MTAIPAGYRNVAISHVAKPAVTTAGWLSEDPAFKTAYEQARQTTFDGERELPERPQSRNRYARHVTQSVAVHRRCWSGMGKNEAEILVCRLIEK